MGIGLVDPILPSLAGKLHASPAQVELLFTSYLVVTAVAMLVTGWVGSRIGAKRTLVAGLVLIVVFSALAGSAHTIGQIVRHRGLLTMGLTALLYNWAFFTVLGYAPFPMRLDTHKLGIAFTAWGVLVAIFAVFGAPRLQSRFGIARTLYVNLAMFGVDVLIIGLFVQNQAVLITAVIATGVFIGLNNTITTQAVMTVAPVERSIASASYGFIRFIGGGLAPFFAGKMVERWNVHVPFYVGAISVALAIAVLSTGHRLLRVAEQNQAAEPAGSREEKEALAEELGSAT